MLTRYQFITLTFACGLSLLSTTAHSKQPAALYVAESSVLENTFQNVRDKNHKTLTPLNQNEDKRDIKITAHIRKAVHKLKALSVDAHNAKIITRAGVVTLRGPVETAAESLQLQEIATLTKGVVQVDNQLEAKAP